MLNSDTPLLSIEWLSLDLLKPDPKNARFHSKKQIDALAKAIKALGFNNPILIDKDNNIIAGNGRIEAAKKLNLKHIPTIRLEYLTPAQIKAYKIADNRIAELAEWNEEALRIELQELSLLNLDFDLTVIGFETPEIDMFLMPEEVASTEEPHPSINYQEHPTCRFGEIWQLGKHKIICGNSLEKNAYKNLLGKERANMVFTDPPYNVCINGHVLTKTKDTHSEFAMASGEMSEEEFIKFLSAAITNLVTFSSNGSLHFICMDWRHIYDLIHVGKQHFSELKNICIWNKSNGGMGSLYRSKHEMITLFKNGTNNHKNNIDLGKHGRYRTNVWDYAGQNSPHKERKENLSMHPTVKPVQMVADAIYDCSDRNDIILDIFGGSGTTLLAAEATGRKARLIEIEPRYVDITIQRWEKQFGKNATLIATGQTYSELKIIRSLGENHG